MTIPYELVHAGDVLRLERRVVDVDPSQDYRLIGVYSFGKGIFTRDPQPGADLGAYRYFSIRPGDLVLSNIQAWEGAIGYATEREAGTIGTHRFLTYVPRNGKIDANWARYFFLSDAGFPLIQRAAPGSVMRNRTLAIERFEALRIPLPPLDKQLAMVDFVERCRAASGRLREKLATYGDQQSTLLRGLTAPPADGAAGPQSRWERVVLGDVLRPVTDPCVVDVDSEYPNVGILSFGRGLFEKPPIQGSVTSARTLFRIKAGQFIYSRLFAFEGAYALVPPRFDGYFVSNEFPTFEVDAERVDPRFLQAYFRWPGTSEEVAQGSKGLGVRRQRVQPTQLLAHTLSLPPLDAQRRAGEAVDQLDRITELRQSSIVLANALDASVINTVFGRAVPDSSS